MKGHVLEITGPGLFPLTSCVMGLSGSELELKGLLNCLIHTGLRATVEDINPALP